MNAPISETKPPESPEETLRLKCPACGCGLNLKRRHLGITGQCIHCRAPLTALERNGSIQVVAGLDPHFSAAVPEIPAPVVEAPAAPSVGSLVPDAEIPAAPLHPPTLATTTASAWGFPDRDSAPALDALPTPPAPQPTMQHEEIPPSVLSAVEPAIPAEPAPSGFTDTAMPPFEPINPGTANLFGAPTPPSAATPAAPISAPSAKPDENPFPGSTNGFSLNAASTGSSNLFMDRNEIPDASPALSKSVLFDDSSGKGKDSSFSSMFKNEDDSSEINPAWGTRVPRESHASISPFATGSESGGGFAESLFREKVAKEPEKIESPGSKSPLFAPPFAKKDESAPIAPVQESYAKKAVLDGDGRPMKAMTKEEEATFAKHLFAVEKTHKRPRWVTKMIKTLVTFSIFGAIGTGVFFFTPEEKLADWKTKAYVWLEPGLAILDYVPEGLRPDWLPCTDLGIDAGVGEDGLPRKKLNAFEGLDKLKGDIGNMRGTAEDELKNINNF